INAVPSWALVLIARPPSARSFDLSQVGATTFGQAGVPTAAPPTPPRPPSTTGGTVPSPAAVAAQVRAAMVPIPAPPAEPVGARLYRAAWLRIAGGEMSAWEERYFLGRCLKPGSRLDPAVMFRVPERWPAGGRVPLRVRTSFPPAFGVEVRFEGGDWKEAVPVRALGLGSRRDSVMYLDPANRPNPKLQFRLGVNTRTVYEGEIVTSLVQRGTEQDFLDALDTPEA